MYGVRHHPATTVTALKLKLSADGQRVDWS